MHEIVLETQKKKKRHENHLMSKQTSQPPATSDASHGFFSSPHFSNFHPFIHLFISLMVVNIGLYHHKSVSLLQWPSLTTISLSEGSSRVPISAAGSLSSSLSSPSSADSPPSFCASQQRATGLRYYHSQSLIIHSPR